MHLEKAVLLFFWICIFLWFWHSQFFGKGAAMPYKPMSCHVGKHVHAAPLHQVWQHHIWATTTMASNWQPRVQISCSMKQNLMYFPCICFCDGQISLGGIDLQIYDMLQEDIGQWSTTSPPPPHPPKKAHWCTNPWQAHSTNVVISNANSCTQLAQPVQNATLQVPGPP